MDKGRMSGPFKEPDWWPVKARTMEGRELHPLPTDTPICFSFCCSLKQSDKVRRCEEDFRRSGQNSTVKTSDSPHHHDVQTLAELARCIPRTEDAPQAWAKDFNGGYRPSGTQSKPLFLRVGHPGGSSDSSPPCPHLRVDGIGLGIQSITFLVRRLLAVTLPLCG